MRAISPRSSRVPLSSKISQKPTSPTPKELIFLTHANKSQKRKRDSLSFSHKSSRLIALLTIVGIAIVVIILFNFRFSSEVKKSIPTPCRNNKEFKLSLPTKFQDQIIQDTVTGYVPFIGTSPCFLTASIQSNNLSDSITKSPFHCVAYFPLVDLRDHLDFDEVYRSQFFLSDSTKQPPSFINRLEVNSNLNSVEYSDRAVLTRCGYKGGSLEIQVNQDRAIIVQPFYIHNNHDSKETSLNARNFLMGVGDGHGEKGQVISDHIARELPKTLGANLLNISGVSKYWWEEEKLVKESISQAILQVEQSISKISLSGSTLSFILRWSSKLYIANVGDSKSIIASYNTCTKEVKIEYITRDDKPELPTERERIESMGGEVMIPPDPPPGEKRATSRVIVPVGLFTYHLAMSRSIGDYEAKAVGVISDPIVDVFNIRDQDNQRRKQDESRRNDIELFAVVATDGIYDFIDPLEVVEYVAKSLYKEDGAPGILTACEDLIMLSSKLWMQTGSVYRDDITIAVNRIQQ